jgi:hypothetical protein
MSDRSSQALTVFVTVQGLNVAGLLVDYLLMKSGLPTISEVSVEHPIVGVTILLFESLSPVSLGLHLWFLPRFFV